MSTSIKQALITIKKLQQQIQELKQNKNEPIAVIGIGCRLPGQINNLADFWQLLTEGKDGIREIPPQHWQQDKYYNSDPNLPGKMYVNKGGFIDYLDTFDAQFFNISPREAVSLDPQQRTLLEVSWEGIENAGITLKQLAGSKTGVFIGICGNDYNNLLLQREKETIDAYLTTGNTHSLASGRLAYFYDLKGPALSVNTACSSSLVAVHLAINSLRDRECNLAIVGGVNRIISPEISINFSKAKMLSPDGLCKTFDASANGFVRSEGCGVIILKRLTDAIAECNNILATLLGSAINQDGRSSGLTAPNGLAQEAVIKQALQNSGKEAQEISYIETHGTGTSLGDPIEVNGLSQVFTQPVYLGSVKANLGHLEAAAGITGLIKTILCLHHKAIPPQIHFNNPNPHINWTELPFTIPRKLTPWISTSPRVAGVSAFGFSGTNAHVIVTEAQVKDEITNREETEYVFTLSAKTETAIRELITRYREFLDSQVDLNLGDLCYSANVGRSDFNYRLAVVTDSLTDLGQQLENCSDQNLSKTKSDRLLEIAFFFPENIPGASIIIEYLRQHYPIFANTLTEVNQSPHLEQFLLQYGLAKLLLACQIIPSFLIANNHIGELVAATIAGVYTKDESLMVLMGQQIQQTQQPQIPILNYHPQCDYTVNLSLDYQQIRRSLLTILAELYLLGFSLDWSPLYSNKSNKLITLPNYPFQRRRYWI